MVEGKTMSVISGRMLCLTSVQTKFVVGVRGGTSNDTLHILVVESEKSNWIPSCDLNGIVCSASQNIYQ